jgi:hypothetical protein
MAKLKDSLAFELEERGQVDNVLNFFLKNTEKAAEEDFLLDDAEFYKPMNVS